MKIINIPKGIKKVVGLKFKKNNTELRNLGTNMICPLCGMKSQFKKFISGDLSNIKLSS